MTNFDEERRYSVFIIPRQDRATIMEDPIQDTNCKEEQEFQVKIDVASKNKMYSTATNFGKSLATNDLVTQVDYKSNGGEESPAHKTGS